MKNRIVSGLITKFTVLNGERRFGRIPSNHASVATALSWLLIDTDAPLTYEHVLDAHLAHRDLEVPRHAPRGQGTRAVAVREDPKAGSGPQDASVGVEFLGSLRGLHDHDVGRAEPPANLRRRPGRNDPSLVHDREAVGQGLRLVHVVRRQ